MVDGITNTEIRTHQRADPTITDLKENYVLGDGVLYKVTDDNLLICLNVTILILNKLN
jgi:hypothetical protein